MKRYKLLKDTSTLKAGTIFVEEGDNFNDYKELVQVVPYGCPNRPFFAVKEINNFDDWFEEITESKRWRAECGEEYWYAGAGGSICCDTEDGNVVDNHRFLTGNYFKTREEAETRKEYIIARQVLLDDAKGGKFMPGYKNIYALYDCEAEELKAIITCTYAPGAIFFHNNADLEKSLKEHKEQWEIVRKYEMGEM